MGDAFPARPSRRRVSRPALLGLAVLAALPVSLALTAVGQASPTLTLPEAEAQLQALQAQEDVAVQAYDAGQVAAQRTAADAATARTAVATQTAKLTALRKGIAGFAVATYEGVQLDPTSTLLAGGDPASVVQRADDLGHIAGVHAAQLSAIVEQQQVLANATTAADQKASAAAAAVTRLAADKAKVDALVQQQSNVVNDLQAQARAAYLAQQAAERAAAEQAAAAARAAQAAQAAAAAAQARSATARTAAAPSSATTTKTAPVTVAPGSNVGETALHYAETKQGDPYVYGAAGPNSFDCSGLTMWAFAQAGVSIPRTAADQMGVGTPVARSDLQPGDLVFYDEGGTIGHVGIYVGNGQMIDANHTGGWVGIRDLYSGYAGARRL